MAAKKRTEKPKAPARSEPAENEIRKRAYEIYLARRNGRLGSELADWLQAEAELSQVQVFR